MCRLLQLTTEISLLHSRKSRDARAPGAISQTRCPPRSRGPTEGDRLVEEELSPDDVLILLEGDVPADRVIEQDGQGPDCCERPW